MHFLPLSTQLRCPIVVFFATIRTVCTMFLECVWPLKMHWLIKTFRKVIDTRRRRFIVLCEWVNPLVTCDKMLRLLVIVGVHRTQSFII